MKSIIPFTLVLLYSAFLSPCWAQVQVGQSIYGEADGDWSGFSVSMPDAHTVAIGAYGNDDQGIDAGQVRVYTWAEGVWQQKGQDIDGAAAGQNAGCSVSMPDPHTVAVGIRQCGDNGTNAGQVRVFSWDGTAWQQQGQALDGETLEDFSGHAVSMPDAQTVAIGAPFNDGNGTDAGHVRVYGWNGTAWQQQGQDIDGEASGDNSGHALCMPDAETVAIGAIHNVGNGSGAGHVRVYAWNGTAWQQQGQDLEGVANSISGSSVSMPDAQTVAIGAVGAGVPYGQVRVYTWNGVTWQQQGQDVEGVATTSDFGWSVSMPDPHTLAVGVKRSSDSLFWSGQVRVYTWSGTDWQLKGLAINGDTPQCFFGGSVSMPDSNTVAVGGHNGVTNGDNTGVVRVYTFGSTSGLVESEFLPGLSAGPNPTAGPLVLSLGAPCEELVVVVRNSLGQEVLRRQYRRTQRLDLDIPGRAGVYAVELRSGTRSRSILVAKE